MSEKKDAPPPPPPPPPRPEPDRKSHDYSEGGRTPDHQPPPERRR